MSWHCIQRSFSDTPMRNSPPWHLQQTHTRQKLPQSLVPRPLQPAALPQLAHIAAEAWVNVPLWTVPKGSISVMNLC
ncbi:unnamed protein product [Caretta caretta]